MTASASAIVLAGGLSTRFGRDKASATLGGITLLERVVGRLAAVAAEVIVVCRPGQDLPEMEGKDVTTVFDRYPGAGPLGGLATGIEAAASGRVIALACDMPFVSGGLLQRLLERANGHDAALPIAFGQAQPLCGVYSKAALGPIRLRLDAGKLKLTDLLDNLDTYVMEDEEWRQFDSEGLSFLNLNTAADFARAETILAAEAAIRSP